MRIAVVLLSFLVVGVTAQSTLTGKWHTVVVTGRPKTDEVLLDLKVDGEKLTGTATLVGSKWSTDRPIQDGKIEGDRFSFKWGGFMFSPEMPPMTFRGTFDGDRITIAIDGYKMELKGERLPPQ
jgi:hypothetical protein